MKQKVQKGTENYKVLETKTAELNHRAKAKHSYQNKAGSEITKQGKHTRE